MPIWKRSFTLEDITSLSADTAVSHLGIEFTEIGDDFLRGRVPVDNRTRQPFGLLFQALDDLRANEVYVATGCAPQFALWGGLMTTRAQHLKAAGAVLDRIGDDHRNLILDCTGIQFVDTSGVNLLTSVIRKAVRQGVEVYLVTDRPELKTMLHHHEAPEHGLSEKVNVGTGCSKTVIPMAVELLQPPEVTVYTIVAVPAATPVITPDASTVAILVAAEDHVPPVRLFV